MGLLTLIHLWTLSRRLEYISVQDETIENDAGLVQAGESAWIYLYLYRFLVFCSSYVWAENMLMPVMFITAQRQLQSENLRLAEGNPFTSLPLGLTVGCLIQDIDSNHSCLAPKLPIDLPFWQLLVGNLITATYIVI